MCLPVAPFRVEREWKHLDLSCAVVQACEAGHRCGYVRVPPGHPAHGRERGELDLRVHGGVNFSETEPCEHEDGQGWWFGFDCGHAHDRMYDPDAVLETLSPSVQEIIGLLNRFSFHTEGHYWTQAEVEAECEMLAEQLADMGG